MNKSEIADGSKIGIRLSTSGTYKPQVVKYDIITESVKISIIISLLSIRLS